MELFASKIRYHENRFEMNSSSEEKYYFWNPQNTYFNVFIWALLLPENVLNFKFLCLSAEHIKPMSKTNLRLFELS